MLLVRGSNRVEILFLLFIAVSITCTPCKHCNIPKHGGKNFKEKQWRKKTSSKVPPTGIPLTIFGDSWRWHGCGHWASRTEQKLRLVKWNLQFTRQLPCCASSGSRTKEARLEPEAGFSKEILLSLFSADDFCRHVSESTASIKAKCKLWGLWCAKMYARIWGHTKCSSKGRGEAENTKPIWVHHRDTKMPQNNIRNERRSPALCKQ